MRPQQGRKRGNHRRHAHVERHGPARDVQIELGDTDSPLDDDAGNEHPAGLLGHLGSAGAVQEEDHDEGQGQVDVHADRVDDGHAIGVHAEAALHAHAGITGVGTRAGHKGAREQNDGQGHSGHHREGAHGGGKEASGSAVIGFIDARKQHGRDPHQDHRREEVNRHRPPGQI